MLTSEVCYATAAAFVVIVMVSLAVEYWYLERRIGHLVEQKKRRHFLTLCISFTHALIGSFGCIISLSLHNDVEQNPIWSWRPGVVVLCLFSEGYFIYDSIDIIYHGESVVNKFYLLHHFVALASNALVLLSGQLLALVAYAFLPEVNTVFMHVRKMMKLMCVPPHRTLAFRLVQLASYVTLVVFRLVPIAWLLYFLVFRCFGAYVWLSSFLTVATALIFAYSLQMFRCLLISDGLLPKYSKKYHDL